MTCLELSPDWTGGRGQGANAPYARNKARLSAEDNIHFESRVGVKDPFRGHQEPKDPNSSDIPGSVGRQHTCDIVTQVRAAPQPRSGHVTVDE